MIFSDASQAFLATQKTTATRAAVSFWSEHFGDLEVTAITTADIERAVDELANTKKRQHICGKGVIERDEFISGPTVNRYIATLGSIFRLLKERRRVPYGFVSPTRGVSRMQGGESRTLTVTVDDVRRLIDAARLSVNPELAAFIAIASTTGLRKGNILGLRWKDLGQGFVDVATTKNGTPTRSVLLPWVETEVRKLKKRGEFIFSVKNPTKALKRALEDARLPTEWTIHHLRHVAASVLAQNGASTIEIMSVLNHKTPNMAMRYSHLNTSTQVKVMEAAWG
jgi:integrase